VRIVYYFYNSLAVILCLQFSTYVEAAGWMMPSYNYRHRAVVIIQVIEEADQNLFNKIRYNPSHILYYLLPRQTEYSYCLRSRSHNFELSYIHDNRNFIDRMLFHPYHIV